MAGGGYDAGVASEKLGRLGPGKRVPFKVPQEARTKTPSIEALCNLQCAECGLQIENDGEARPACPACGEQAWAALRSGGVLEALIEQEDTLWDTRDARRRGLSKLVGVVLGVLLMTATMRGDGSFVFYPLVIMALVVVVRSSFREMQSGTRPQQAASWSHARRALDPSMQQRSGVAVGDSLLTAPLSGRACLAYELGVRSDDNAQDEDWSWTLLEQRVVPMSVGEHRMQSQPYLRLRRTLHQAAMDESAKFELRKRGVDLSRPGYCVYESVLLPGEIATVDFHALGTVLST